MIFFRVDAFCDGPRGNPAAVVLCTSGEFPSIEAMKGISQSFLCDTCFVIPPPLPQQVPRSLRAKFFTAKPQEAVFIGHAAIAALAVVDPPPGADEVVEYLLSSGPDDRPVTTAMTARWSGAAAGREVAGTARVTFSFVVPHPKSITGVVVDEAVRRAISATPLSASTVIGTSGRLIILVEDIKAVTPDRAMIEAVSRQFGVGGIFVVQQNLGDTPPSITTRYFQPSHTHTLSPSLPPFLLFFYFSLLFFSFFLFSPPLNFFLKNSS